MKHLTIIFVAALSMGCVEENYLEATHEVKDGFYYIYINSNEDLFKSHWNQGRDADDNIIADTVILHTQTPDTLVLEYKTSTIQGYIETDEERVITYIKKNN